MGFEAYSERPATLHGYHFESKAKKIEQKRFQIVNTSMQMKSDKKIQFADGIASLPFGHFLLSKAREVKETHREELHTKIQNKML